MCAVSPGVNWLAPRRGKTGIGEEAYQTRRLRRSETKWRPAVQMMPACSEKGGKGKGPGRCLSLAETEGCGKWKEELRSWNGPWPGIESGDGRQRGGMSVYQVSGREEEDASEGSSSRGCRGRNAPGGTDVVWLLCEKGSSLIGSAVETLVWAFGGGGGKVWLNSTQNCPNSFPGPSHRWRLPPRSPKFLDLVGERSTRRARRTAPDPCRPNTHQSQ